MKKRSKRKIKPGGKPVETPTSKNKFKQILNKRMVNTEDSDLERTTKSPELPETTPPEL